MMTTDLESEYLRLPGLQEGVIEAWEAAPNGGTAAVVAELNLLTALRAIARARANATRVPPLDQYVETHAEGLAKEAARGPAPQAVQDAPPPESEPEPAARAAEPAIAPPNDDEDLPPP